MTYSELLAFYVKSKKILLVKNMIDKEVPKFSLPDQLAFFLDIRVFNPILTYKKNKKIKLDISRKIGYDSCINFGDKEGAMLYRREALDNGKFLEYYPNGFLKKLNNFTYTYKFYGGYYVQTTRKNKTILLELNKSYSSIFELFGRVWNKFSSIFLTECSLLKINKSDITIVSTNVGAIKDIIKSNFTNVVVDNYKVIICVG